MGGNTLEEFRTQRALWIECLSGDDRHSIINQIADMVWNTAAFRVVNEARKIAPPSKEGGVQINGLLHRLVNHGFVGGQMLAIRRLTDNYPIAGSSRNRDVFSLTSLLEDMREHTHLMTRANIFAAEGLEHDADRVRERRMEYGEKMRQEGKRAYAVPMELDWRRLERRHQEIDCFAGVSAGQRLPDDAVRPSVLVSLREKIVAVCKNVHVHVNKCLAHAASPESRDVMDADSREITLTDLYAAHEAICKVASFVSVHLLGGSGLSRLAVPQYDHFAYIDKPLVATKNIPALNHVWEDYDKETHEWQNWGMKGFRQKFEQ